MARLKQEYLQTIHNDAATMNVLIADDVSVIRKMIVNALAKFDVDSYDAACDGREAIRLLQDNAYHLIVTDWNMPGFSGLEVAKEARFRGCNGPIIMQTTESQKENVMLALKAGVTDYIIKPFTMNALEKKLEQHVYHAAMLPTHALVGKRG